MDGWSKHFFRVSLVILGLSIFTSFSSSRDETPSLLHENIKSLMDEGREYLRKGEIKEAGDKFRVAIYLLEKLRRDFPDWNRQTVSRDLKLCRSALRKAEPGLAPAPTAPLRITCSWKLISPGKDFEPEEGKVYKIKLGGEDRQNLELSYEKLEPYEGDARICVHLENTKQNDIIQDIKNEGLFEKEKGSFALSLSVPGGFPFFLAEFTEDQYAQPVILSNILYLP